MLMLEMLALGSISRKVFVFFYSKRKVIDVTDVGRNLDTACLHRIDRYTLVITVTV